MLKPEQIKSHSFISNTDGGYQKQDIDNFFAEVCSSYEQMFKENAELVGKLGSLAKLVAQYKEDEDNIRRALLAAERMSTQIRREAEDEVAQKREKADKTYSELVSTAQNNADVIETKARVAAQQLTEDSTKAAQERVASAERTAASMISDAQQKAADIVENAKHFAQQELDRINHEIKVNTVTLKALSEEVTSFKQALLDSYRKHIEYITTLPREEDFNESSETPAIEPETADEAEVIKAADVFTAGESEEMHEEVSPVAKAEFNFIVDSFTEDTDKEQSTENDVAVQDNISDEDSLSQDNAEDSQDEAEEISFDFGAIADDIDEKEAETDSDSTDDKKSSLFKDFFKK